MDLYNPQLAQHNRANDPTYGLEKGYLSREVKAVNTDPGLPLAQFVKIMPDKQAVSQAGIVTITQQTMTNLALEVEASDSGSLVVAIPYFPGWTATVTPKDDLSAQDKEIMRKLGIQLPDSSGDPIGQPTTTLDQPIAATSQQQAIPLPHNQQGLMQLPLNQGKYAVTLVFKRTRVRQVGDAITLVAILLLVLLWLPRFQRTNHLVKLRHER